MMNWLINFFFEEKTFNRGRERKKINFMDFDELKILMSLLEKIMYACLTLFL